VDEIIDIHPHVLATDQAAYPLAPVGGKVSGWASTRPVTAEQLLAQMDATGIAQAALVQASTAYGYDNSYVLDSAARYPDRFVAVGCLDPLAPDTPAKVAELAGLPQLAGIRLFTTGSTLPGQAQWLSDEATAPFWAAAEGTGLPVCVQMRLSAADQLISVLERYPSARIVLDHMAYPPIAPGQERAAFDELAPLAKYPQLHLKLTIRNIEPLATADAGAFLGPLLDAFGSERIAWGSNFPAAEQPLATLAELARSVLAILPGPDRASILAGTARRLYPSLIRR
jgi:predicted TIM-barrel fold metal-dependent hydrolase